MFKANPWPGRWPITSHPHWNLIPSSSSPTASRYTDYAIRVMTTLDEEMQYNTLRSNTPNSVRVTMSEQFK